MGIMDDDMDIDMAQTKVEKEHALRAKSSKTWRILRLSAKSKLGTFQKLEDGKNVKVLFDTNSPTEDIPQALEGASKASEAAAKDPVEGHTTTTEPGLTHGVGSAEKGNLTVATEQKSGDSADAIAAGKEQRDVK